MGATGMAWANDANVKAKATAINLVIFALQVVTSHRDKFSEGIATLGLTQIKIRDEPSAV